MLDKSELQPKKLFLPNQRLLALGGLAFLTLVGAGVVYFKQQPQMAPRAPALASVPRVTKITALGRLEPQGEVIAVSASSNGNNSDRVDQILVEEGTQVKAGQVIAVLDSRDRLQAVLERVQGEVGSAHARLAQVKAGAKQGDILAQGARFQRTQAELEGQIATQKATIASLEAQLEGETSAQKAAIERLKANFRESQKDCQRYKTLYEEGSGSAQEQDRFCLQAETAQDSLDEGQANLNRIISTWQQKIKEARANLERTVATIDKQIQENQATLNAVTEVRPEDVQVARSDLITAKAALKVARADLELAYVRAPKAGEILKIHTKSGELVGSKGIAELGQTGQMYAVAEVYETDITRVKLGQLATVTSEALSENLRGKVEHIGRQVNQQNILDSNPTADSDARIVEVKIRLDAASSQKVRGLTNQRIRATITL